MRFETIEAIEQAIADLPHRSGLYTEELQAICDFCIKKGDSKAYIQRVIFWPTMAAEAIGFAKGRAYERNRRKIRNRKKSLAHAANDRPETR